MERRVRNVITPGILNSLAVSVCYRSMYGSEQKALDVEISLPTFNLSVDRADLFPLNITGARRLPADESFSSATLENKETV